MTTRATILLLCLLAFAAPAQAIMLCTEPDVPTCAEDLDSIGTSDEWEFENCKSELESFKDELESYVECLKEHIDELMNEYNEQVRKYNCKARREGFCD